MTKLFLNACIANLKLTGNFVNATFSLIFIPYETFFNRIYLKKRLAFFGALRLSPILDLPMMIIIIFLEDKVRNVMRFYLILSVIFLYLKMILKVVMDELLSSWIFSYKKIFHYVRSTYI